jgi:hypothetical protein
MTNSTVQPLCTHPIKETSMLSDLAAQRDQLHARLVDLRGHL